MSLIVEALKRARDDATRRQAASKGLPLAPVPRLRSRSRWLSFALVPLVAALVVCILLLVDLYSRLPQSPGPGQSESNVAELPQPSGDSTSPLSTEEIPPGSTPQVESADDGLTSAISKPSPAPATQSPPPSPLTPADDNPQPVVESVQAQRATSQPSPQPAPSVANQSGREFVGQAQLVDGQLVDLEGIAWSESEPFALLNGQVVGVGESIRAYRVTEISQNQVVLEQGDDRIVLRLE